MLREATEGLGVRAAVVIDDDDDGTVGARGDVVQRLPAHAAGQRAIADDRDDMAALAPKRVSLREAVGIRKCRGRMGILDVIVVGLGAARVARKASRLAQRVEGAGAAGQHLVDVSLVSGVPQQRVTRRIEDPVQRESELDDAEVGAEVATGAADRIDQLLADIGGQGGELLIREVSKVGGPTYLRERCHGPSVEKSDNERRMARPAGSRRTPAVPRLRSRRGSRRARMSAAGWRRLPDRMTVRPICRGAGSRAAGHGRRAGAPETVPVPLLPAGRPGLGNRRRRRAGAGHQQHPRCEPGIADVEVIDRTDAAPVSGPAK